MIKLFVFDIDNTVTQGPSVWEIIHLDAGTWDQGEKYLQEFLAGKITFPEFARKDVACWQGLKESLLYQAFAKVSIRRGLKELVHWLKEQKIKTALISSTLYQFAQYLQQQYGFDYITGNMLEINSGSLTGNLQVDLCCSQKDVSYQKLLEQLSIDHQEVAGVGDSEYDLAFLQQVRYPFIIGNYSPREHSVIKVEDFFEVQKHLQQGIV